jgi:hypothetical protein
MKTIRNYDEYGECIEISLAHKDDIKIVITDHDDNFRLIELSKQQVVNLIKDLKYIIGE